MNSLLFLKKIEADMQEAKDDSNTNGVFLEALRSKVKYKRLKMQLEEMYLVEKILDLPYEMRMEVIKFIDGQRKAENTNNRK